MSRYAIAVIFLIGLLAPINSQGIYSIMGPGVIRPNSEYHVAVSVHKSSEPTTVKLGIISTDYSNFKTVDVQPYSTELVKFDIGDIKKDDYKLTAEGLSGIIFTNETKLDYREKQHSVLFQTDKAIYKPGDTVRYRVLVIDANTKPAAVMGETTVSINDGKRNKIKQVKNVKFNKGVYSDELKLSTFPVLGKWTLEAEVDGKTYTRQFEVAEYVLPKFEVTIDTPSNAVYKDGKVRATVRAKYTFGKPILGEATVSIYPKTYGSIQPFLYDLITRKVVPLDGKARVEFDIRNELNFKDEYERELHIEAIVEEKLTGRKQNTSTTIKLRKDRYKIEGLNLPSNFEPDVPFTFKLRVLKLDGSPVMDTKNPVKISMLKDYEVCKKINETEYFIGEDGTVTVTWTLPESGRTYYSINAEYLDTEQKLGYLAELKNKAVEDITLEVLTEKPKLNDEVSVAVTTKNPMKYLMYQVIGRGDILVSKTVEVSNKNYTVFKFLASFAMLPRAKLLVYFVTDGNLIFEEKTIEFVEKELNNFIKVDLPAQTSPGQEIDINIATKPNSFVGLLGVDQSVLLLKSGNDLKKDDVFSELNGYETHTPYMNGYGKYPGQSSGAITLTNANFPWNEYRVFYEYQSSGFGGAAGRPGMPGPPGGYPMAMEYDAPMAFGPSKHDSSSAPVVKIRKEFPETWLWETLDDKWATSTRPPTTQYRTSTAPYRKTASFASQLEDDVQYTPERASVPTIAVRKEFPETWLWETYESFDAEGRLTLHKKVPDTITSWIITGFSLDPVTGLGLTKTPRKMQVYQPFFVATDLPYSVKRGEVLAVPILVFNYLEKDLEAEVTLDNTAQEFEFTEITNEVEEAPKIELYRRKRIAVPSNTGKAVSFMIRPTKVGHITIKFTATSPLAGDSVERSLIVEPEGVTEYVNRGVLVDLREKADFAYNVTIDVPKNVVPDSTYVEVSVVGDLLGPTIKNLDSLIRIPYGCGEQNMVNFVPNILVLKYLQKTSRSTPAIATKAKQYMEVGYQRQLSYKHPDGSYSAFGLSDKGGSTWLTAYTARSFKQASEFLDIDPKVIDMALDFLVANQAENGSFPEVGHVIDKQHASKTDHGVGLTSFVLLAFLENKELLPKYRNAVNKALNYVVNNLDGSDDVYSLAIAAYALQMADHSSKDTLLTSLDSRATSDADRKWWNLPVPESEKKSPWYYKPRSVNVEMTSYALLALLEAGHVTESLPVLKWLISQRNSKGGFESTQDTVVGLQALIKFAENLSAKDSNVQVVFGYGDGEEKRLNVNEENAIVLQSYELPSDIKYVTVAGSGRGSALASVSYKYNVNVTGAWPRFNLDPQVHRISHSDYLHLTICTSFVPAGGTNESNMAVMEITMPSGFTIDPDTLPSLEATERVKKVETKNGDTVVVVYFDGLDVNEVCPTVDAFKTHKVANQKPAPVIIYDYYDNARQARQFYSAPKSTLCDICEGSDCGTQCAARAEERAQLGMDGRVHLGGSSWILPSITMMLFTFIARILC